jgi:hypothetical protein
VDKGEGESGVVDSDVAFSGGQCTCKDGHGMATLGEACTGWVLAIRGTTDVEGDEALEDERRYVGWKYESCANNLIRLSTGRLTVTGQTPDSYSLCLHSGGNEVRQR